MRRISDSIWSIRAIWSALAILCLSVSAFGARVPLLEDFEEGVLPSDWELTGTPGRFGRVTSEFAANQGVFHVVLDDSDTSPTASRNELTWRVDLAGDSNVRLIFYARKFGGTDDPPPPSPFAGGADYDGVAVSADGGATWSEIQDLRSSLTTAYKKFTLDLDAKVAAAGLSYTDGFLIRFNQYDNGLAPAVGIAIDNVALVHNGTAAIEADPLTLDVTVPRGQDRLGLSFNVRNSGNGVLSYAVASNQSWASAWPDVGQSVGEPVKVGVSLASSTLAIGDYSANLTVSEPGGSATSAQVKVNLHIVAAGTTAALPFFETFESGSLAPFWTTRSSSGGRARLLTTYFPHNGRYHLVFDDTLSGGTYARNEATLHLNLQGEENVWISFRAKSLGDEPHTLLADPFADGADFDGVAISADGGATWYQIVPLVDLELDTWKFYAADLDEFIDSKGLSYNSDFLIRWTQYDDSPVPDDGYAIDDVVIDRFDQPFLTVSPSLLTVTTRQGASPANSAIKVKNEGTGTMNYSVSTDRTWLHAQPVAGSSTGEEDEVAIIYNTASLTETTYNAKITVSAPDSVQTRQVVNVVLTIDLNPTIALDTSSLSLQVDQGENLPAKTFKVRNSGKGILHYSISSDVDWMTVTPAEGVSTGEYDSISIQFRTSELGRGLHNGFITISDPVATNGSVKIPVSVVVIADSFIKIVSTGHYPDSVFPEVAVKMLVDTVPGRSCGLSTSDFTIQEGGVAATVTTAECSGTAGATKVDVVFLFDDTQSMRQEIDGMKSEASELAAQILVLGLDARFGLVTFKDEVDFDQDLTNDIEVFQAAVDRLHESAGGDSPEVILDAALFSLNNLDFRPDARKVFIIITDATTHILGDGAAQSVLSIPTATAILKQAKATVFSVSPNFQSAAKAGSNGGSDADPLAKAVIDDVRAVDPRVLAEGTGGAWIDLRSSDFSRIADWMRDVISSVYTVKYLSPNATANGGTRNVCVEVADAVKGSAVTCSSYRAPTSTQGAIQTNTKFLRPLVRQGSNPPNDSFTVRNGLGGGTINYNITSNRAWVKTQPTSGSSTTEEDEINVIYDMTHRYETTYAMETGYDLFASITLTDNFSVNRVETVYVFPRDIFPNPDNLMALTSFTDMWISVNEQGVFQTPFRMSWLGFHNGSETNWKTIVGDFNGNGSVDAATITNLGEFWIATSNQDFVFEPPRKAWTGLLFRPEEGWDVFAGDFDGNGASDILQVDPGQYTIFWNDGTGYYTGDHVTADLAFSVDRANGLWIMVADTNGDGKDDVIQVNNAAGELNAMLGARGGLGAPQLWGTGNYKHDPDLKSALLFGDYNGDGKVDVCLLNDHVVEVGLGDSIDPPQLAAPASWSPGLGFHNDPEAGEGWWVFAADVNGDGNDDLVQVTDLGQIWMAISNGHDGFGGSTYNAGIGFHHKPDGAWQTYINTTD